MIRGPLREVECYVWDWEDDGLPCFTTVPARDYWVGVTAKENRKGSWIVVGEPYKDWRNPDRERLECGHIQPMPVWGGYEYFNRRRRCKQCTLEGMCSPS